GRRQSTCRPECSRGRSGGAAVFKRSPGPFVAALPVPARATSQHEFWVLPGLRAGSALPLDFCQQDFGVAGVLLAAHEPDETSVLALHAPRVLLEDVGDVLHAPAILLDALRSRVVGHQRLVAGAEPPL